MDDTTSGTVCLEDVGDWDIVKSSIWSALYNRLQIHLPQVPIEQGGTPLGEDELKCNVLQQLQDFHHLTFKSALENVSINGVLGPKLKEAKSDIDAYEPFDVSLQQQLQLKISQLEDIISNVTSLRREARNKLTNWQKELMSQLNQTEINDDDEEDESDSEDKYTVPDLDSSQKTFEKALDLISEIEKLQVEVANKMDKGLLVMGSLQ